MTPAHPSADPLSLLTSELKADLGAVDQVLRERADSEHVDRIQKVAAHLLDAGGKRLRPLLTLAAARLFGYEGRDHILLAAAVEFIHSATLLHDDVVDESHKRRGRPTANLLWGNQSSVLVGDFFFARSFQLMVRTSAPRSLAILADASATIAEAEVMQLVSAQNLDTSEAQYLQVIRGKTAALFSAAAEVGGVVAGAEVQESDALAEFGDCFGICFQIMDDLLDYSGATMSLGKNIGDDFRDRKVTLPVVKAYLVADTSERQFWSRVFGKGKQADGDFEHALELLTKRGILDQTYEDATHWCEKAKEKLERLPQCRMRELLAGLADFTLTRST